jgi:hypothetical protein
MKPPTAAGYGAAQLEQVRSVCLYVATKLADLRDEWVIIGGLVPSLLIDQQRLNAIDRHVGTLDVDLGLQLGILAQEGYREISARLREAGFGPDSNEAGKLVRQRWKHSSAALATVEFLIPPAAPGQHGGTLQNLERDFAAVVAPGVDLAFRDRRLVTLSGTTVLGEAASRDVFVCGPGAYVILKALAFAGRGANKDAYDLFYVLQHYEGGLTEIAESIRRLRGEPSVTEALGVLDREFRRVDATGPTRTGVFLGLVTDELRAQVVGLVDALLRMVA